MAGQKPRNESPETAAYAEAVAEVAKLTQRVRKLEQQLAALQGERRAAMRHAAELGATFYRIAKAADTSQASATRMIRDDDSRGAR